jgi:hypothetical protein
MAIDFSKVNKLVDDERVREKGNSFGPRILWWKPQSGENRIRICPPWTTEGANADVPFREVYRHWSVGEGGYVEEGGLSFTCPVKTSDGPGGTCEVCDLVTELRNSGSPADSEFAKQLYAKRRLYSNMVDLKDPVYTQQDMDDWEDNARDGDECHFSVGDTKVQVFSYGTTIYKQLLDFLQDEIDLTEFSDPVEIKLVREGKGLNTKYRLRLNTRSKPLEVVGDLSELMYDLDDITPFPKEGAMSAALSGESVKKPEALETGAARKAPGLPSSAVEEAVRVSTPSTVVEEEDEDPPECFNDCKTQDDEDPVCTGGSDGKDNYDACEFVTECRETKLVAISKKKKPSRGRRKAAAPTSAPTAETVDDIEAMMQEAMQ